MSAADREDVPVPQLRSAEVPDAAVLVRPDRELCSLALASAALRPETLVLRGAASYFAAGVLHCRVLEGAHFAAAFGPGPVVGVFVPPGGRVHCFAAPVDSALDLDSVRIGGKAKLRRSGHRIFPYCS